jgi:hypothetical protein
MDTQNLQLWTVLEKLGQRMQNVYKSAEPDTAFLYSGFLSFAYDVLRRSGHHPRHDPDQWAERLRVAVAFDALEERWHTGQAIDDATLDRIAGELERLTAELEEEFTERQRERVAVKNKERLERADKARTWLRDNGLPDDDTHVKIAIAASELWSRLKKA